uniref:Uncharacterized protein n=1 Tax=Dicentrarchus labrax TaxID=13489 RepID=A0A8C4DP09_DICLA
MRPIPKTHRINLVPELQGSLNSQVAEQLFSCTHKNNYFLNNMAPSTPVFLMRNRIHHRNNKTNAQHLEKHLQRGRESHRLQDITLDKFGCLTRADFWGLGLNKEMESTIGNACFEVIEKIADLYIVPTWRKQDCVIHLQAYLNLSQSLNPGNWTEKTGLQIQDFPRQPYGIDCGIFMLMVVDIICYILICVIHCALKKSALN